MDERFRDRREAGGLLADALGEKYGDRDDVVVLALPRGGVPIGREVARALGAPLDVIVVRKLGAPGRPELAMGAIASGGVRILESRVVGTLGVDEETIEEVAGQERAELERREAAYREDRSPIEIEGRIALIVDDGAATGSTLRAAIRAAGERGPERVVAAVPVAPPDTVERLKEVADEVVCPRTPVPFAAIGAWYEEFPQVSDEEVREILGELGGEGRAGD